MHVTFFLKPGWDDRPDTQPEPLMVEVMRRVADQGVATRAVVPEEHDPSEHNPPATDLVVLKSKSPAALALGQRYAEAGVPALNSLAVSLLCRDKPAVNQVLTDAGLPVPQTWLEDDPQAFVPLLRDGPLIIKPFKGSQGRGITVAHTPDDLVGIDHGRDPVMAQRYYAPDGLDRKLYGIGDEIFCVQRIWPPRTLDDKLGRLVDDPAAAELARGCGEALGIDLLGVDVIEHAGQRWVVDLSSFPGFKGVPDNGRRLADRVITELNRDRPVK